MAREGVPPIVIRRQLGHSNLGITPVYLEGIDSGEIIETVHADVYRWSRSAPRCAATSSTAEPVLLLAQLGNASAEASRCTGSVYFPIAHICLTRLRCPSVVETVRLAVRAEGLGPP
jgi:hypothetical protein